MGKNVRIGVAAEMLGVTVATLRKWEKTGELVPSRRSRSGTRYYSLEELTGLRDDDRLTVCYARVSGDEPLEDLDRQQALLVDYCSAKGWSPRVIRDVGSGLDCGKEGLQELLELIAQGRARRLVLTHRERLLRFGSELVFSLCGIRGVEVVITHQGGRPPAESELPQDIQELADALSCRLVLSADGDGAGGLRSGAL